MNQKIDANAIEQIRSKLSVQTSYHLDYNDFDNIVEQVYGHRYEIVADEELHNYMSKEMNGKKEKIDNYDQKGLDKFIETGKSQYISRILLIDMVNRDILPEGNYIIEVYW